MSSTLNPSLDEETRKGAWKPLLLVAPLPLWIPLAFLLMIGTQGAHSHEAARTVLMALAGLTVALLVLAVYGIRRYGARSQYGVVQWTAVGILGALLMVPIGLIVYVGVRAAFW